MGQAIFGVGVHKTHNCSKELPITNEVISVIIQ
jgi:hypothetical protein